MKDITQEVVSTFKKILNSKTVLDASREDQIKLIKATILSSVMMMDAMAKIEALFEQGPPGDQEIDAILMGAPNMTYDVLNLLYDTLDGSTNLALVIREIMSNYSVS
jgi:cellobiose-specific phosphotransferase system component IIC